MSQEKYDFCLSCKCVENLPFDKYEKDFTFIVNGKSYQTSRFVADLISPLIRKLHYTDQSLNEFIINTDTFNTKENTEYNYFDEFLSLTRFEQISIDPTHQKHFLQYFYILGNIEEYFRLQPDFLKTLTTDSILDRLQTFTKTQKENDKICNATASTSSIFEEMIKYASEHFEHLDKEKMKDLPKEIISEIVENENLKLHDEDSLLNFILELYAEDHSYAYLFEYVLFNNVSEEILERFVHEFDVEYINNRVFQSICKRFFKNENVKENRYTKLTNAKEFKPQANEYFEGILRYLTKQTGGNIHDNGTIDISSNSIGGSSYHPKNSLDYQSNNVYYSKNESNSFVCIDFKDKSVQISSYAIQSTSGSYVHLKNWSIEVSEDGKDWEEIDRHTNDSTLNGYNQKSLFTISKPPTKFYRFIRLLQTGEGWNGNYIGFAFIEIYGKLQEPKI